MWCWFVKGGAVPPPHQKHPISEILRLNNLPQSTQPQQTSGNQPSGDPQEAQHPRRNNESPAASGGESGGGCLGDDNQRRAEANLRA